MAATLNNMCYPAPEASHAEVLADPALFNVTLNKMLALTKAKVRIPKINGIEVDLHLLYHRVTELGGLEPVCKHKQWVIVCEPFNFPASFTNKSYVIKKLYCGALHHYEQVYFHKRTGALVPPPVGPTDGAMESPGRDGRSGKRRSSETAQAAHYTPPRQLSSAAWHGAGGGELALRANSGCPAPGWLNDGAKFSGSIDSAFDAGYLVTLTVGGQQLSGMLYPHAPPGLGAPPMRAANGQDNSMKRARVGTGLAPGGAQGVRPARKAFQFFQLGIRKGDLLQSMNPDPSAPLSKDDLFRITSEMWAQMHRQQKKPFDELAKKDLVRYEQEMVEQRANALNHGMDAVEVTTPTAGARSRSALGGTATPGYPPTGPLHHAFSTHAHMGLAAPLAGMPGANHLCKSASMPPRAHAPANLSDKPGYQQPDEHDNLCHYDNGKGGATGGGLPFIMAAVPFDEQDHLAADDDTADAFALGLAYELGQADAPPCTARGDIDLFGCSVRVNKTGGGGGDDGEKGALRGAALMPMAPMPSVEHDAPGRHHQQRHEDGHASSAGAPPHGHHVMPHTFHNMLEYQAPAEEMLN
ncbi:hypothetical protein FOA52_000679 [Chlamydomonas sp. UWO 241]|nr:hypothetical protein FOA52_000679 [Chlamydomonas sp. UWO 241]